MTRPGPAARGRRSGAAEAGTRPAAPARDAGATRTARERPGLARDGGSTRTARERPGPARNAGATGTAWERPGAARNAGATRTARERSVRTAPARDAGDRVGHPASARAAGQRRGGRGPAHGARRGRRGDPADRFAPPYRIVELRSPDGPLRARLDPTAPQRRPIPSVSRARRPPAGPVRRFVRVWGWRAYALPLLCALSVLCGIDVANGTAAGVPLLGRAADPPPAAAPPVPTAGPGTPAASASPRSTPTPTGIFVDDGGAGTARPLPPTALPAGGRYTQRGSGRFDVVAGTSRVYGSGPLHRFTVELEAGVTDDGPAFAAAVERTLSDPRSWGYGGQASFQRVDSGPVDFRVSLTASLTVRKLCGYDLPYETSCYNGDLARVVINDARWVRGAVAYKGRLDQYRLYVVNHEVGHALGNAHLQCPGAGALAPVMMQQTLGIDTPGVGACRPNPWPHP